MKLITHNSLLKSRAAFTLVEVVVAVAIMAVLSTAGFLALSNVRGRQNLEKTTDEVVAAIVGTQKRSISQDAGKRWNVRFSNTTSSGSQYMVFSGASYATSAIDRTYGLSRNISFSEPSSGNLFDAFFAPFSGTLPAKKIISMVDGRKDGFVGDIIMNAAGRILSRQESGLVGYWHFDEGAGTNLYDASGYGNTGILSVLGGGSQTTSTQVWLNGASGIAGGSLNLDGTDDFANNGSGGSLELTTGTVTAWIKTTNAGTSYRGIVVKQSAYGMFLGDNIFLIYDWSNGATLSTGVNLADGVWHQVGFSFQSGVVNGTVLYIDGKPKLTTTWTLSSSGTGVGIGAGASTGGFQNFAGQIDEVRIYNRILSPAEILNQYNDLK